MFLNLLSCFDPTSLPWPHAEQAGSLFPITALRHKATVLITLFFMYHEFQRNHGIYPLPNTLQSVDTCYGQGPASFHCGLHLLYTGRGFLVALSAFWRRFLPEQLLWLNWEGCVPAKYMLWGNMLIEPACGKGFSARLLPASHHTHSHQWPSTRLFPLSCLGNGWRWRGPMWRWATLPWANKSICSSGSGRRPLPLCPGRGEEVLCNEARSRSFQQGSSASAWFCWREGRWPVHCPMFSSIPALYRRMPVASTDCDKQKCLQTLQNVPW